MEMGDWESAKPLVKAYISQGNSWKRYQWLGERIQALPGALDEKTALKLLTNGPVQCNATLHSCVFDPKNQAVYLAVAGKLPVKTASRTPYVYLDLGEWFRD